MRDIQNLPDNGHLYAAHVINDLWRATQGKALVVTDVGQHQMWTAQYYHFDHPGYVAHFRRSGHHGLWPAGRHRRQDRPPGNEVWVIAGDGGFQMTMAELTTAAQENIKVNVAIINNGYLGMVRQWQEFFYEKRYSATPMRSPDFVKIAEAMGLTGLRVTRTRPRSTRRAPSPGDRRHCGDRFPGRAGRCRLPDGAGRGRPARDDPPAQAQRAGRNCSKMDSEDMEERICNIHL